VENKEVKAELLFENVPDGSFPTRSGMFQMGQLIIVTPNSGIKKWKIQNFVLVVN
jgi:hypothetical protein